VVKNREALIDAALERLKALQDWTIDHCSCEDALATCWYHLSEEGKQRLVCGAIVDAVVLEVGCG
jgi:hypothetical protein